MARKRGEAKGQLFVQGKLQPTYYVRYPIWNGNKKTVKTVWIGRAADITSDQAQSLASGLIAKEQSEAKLVNDMQPADYHLRPALLTLNSATPKHDPTVRGMIGEMIVASDLLSRGYEVFQPVNKFSRFDLLYLDQGKPVKVEVKVTKLDAKGRPTCDLKSKFGRFDVLAVVLPGGTIEYRSHALCLEAKSC